MITVNIKKKNNKIETLIFHGHAMYADFGKDIVCAGVSSILITTVNAILKFDKNAVTYQKGKDFILSVHKWDSITNLLIENLMDLLKEMAKDYPKNIKIREDEDNE